VPPGGSAAIPGPGPPTVVREPADPRTHSDGGPTYCVRMAALRSLEVDRTPFLRPRFTLSLLAVIVGEIVGMCVIAYLVADVI
jgi:hypothetical protein